MKEFNLSEKIKEGKDYSTILEFLEPEDVKEAIKLLKQDLNEANIFADEIINKRMGKELI